MRWVTMAVFLSTVAQGACEPGRRFGVAVHGGAGSWSGAVQEDKYFAHVRAVLATAYAVLSRGGTSLDAVQAAVTAMEDGGHLNAGKGAVKTKAGRAELDASIMDGRTLRAGAVGAVRTVKNPLRAARLVMEKTKHVLLVGEGAESFAAQQGVPVVGPEYFQKVEPNDGAGTYGTVGAVALDCDGHLAAATSTGGLSGKMTGRLGDSPIPGAGNYANDATVAVSGTGTGELFIRAVGAYDISARMAYLGESLVDAAAATLKKLGPAGSGGFIAIDRDGNVTQPFSTDGMLRGWVREDGKAHVALR